MGSWASMGFTDVINYPPDEMFEQMFAAFGATGAFDATDAFGASVVSYARCEPYTANHILRVTQTNDTPRPPETGVTRGCASKYVLALRANECYATRALRVPFGTTFPIHTTWSLPTTRPSVSRRTLSTTPPSKLRRPLINISSRSLCRTHTTSPTPRPSRSQTLS